MKLNHLDLHVHDVPRTLAFFREMFGLTPVTSATSPALAVLTDDLGFVLVLQRCAADQRYPDGFHVGFLVDDVAEVERLHARASAEGLPVSDVLVNGRGTMIYLARPEGYHVEVSCQRRRPGARAESSV